MTSKYSLGNAYVELWTDLTVKFVDIVCIIIKMYCAKNAACGVTCPKSCVPFLFLYTNMFHIKSWNFR